MVDQNRIQGIGSTQEVLDLEPLEEKFRSFGFDVTVALEGNSFSSLRGAFDRLEASPRPKAIIAKTTKGHGVSYMQNKVEWHYLPMSEDQYRLALQELESNAT